MNCDIYIVFGKSDEQFIITAKEDISSLPKESTYIVLVPELDLDNVSTSDDAIRLLLKGNRIRATHNGQNISLADANNAFISLLSNANSTLDTSDIVDRLGESIHFLDNITYNGLKDRFINEMKNLPDVAPRPYHISLILDKIISGDKLHGRIFVNGIETFVLRNREDVEDFSKTERSFYLMDKIIGKPLDNGQIDDNYINNEENNRKDLLRIIYSQDLMNIVNHINDSTDKKIASIKERIKRELGVSNLTIKSVLRDYLYHKSDYLFKIAGEQRTKLASVPITNFFNELLNNSVSYNDDEDEFTATLRELSPNKDEFGKDELYDILLNFYGDEFTQACTLDLFAKADKEQMYEILNQFFKNHASIQNFKVESVDETKDEKVKLTDVQISALFKKKLKQLNKGKKKDLRITGELNDLVTDIESAKQYIGTEITLRGNTYNLSIVEEDGLLAYYYNKVGMSNKLKIKLSYSGQVLENVFNVSDIGMDTFDLILPYNESEVNDPVVNGKYHGYYIYETNYPNLPTQYFISRSVISPKLYMLDGSVFSTPEKAKLAIKSYNLRNTIRKATNLGLKLNTPTKAIVILPNNSSAGLTLDSIDVPFERDVTGKLNGSEYNLYYNGNLNKFLTYYKLYFALGTEEPKSILELKTKILDNLDRIIDTPEKAGVFILKLVENGISSNDLTTPTENSLKQTLVILDIIENAKINLFLVRNSKVKQLENGIKAYVTQLLALSDIGLTVNSAGKIVENDMPAHKSLTLALNDLAQVFNEGLFKDSGILIKITDSLSLKTDEEFFTLSSENEEPKNIFESVLDMRSVKGFVYNGNIYINQSNIDKSVKTMYHEIFHIALGAIRVNDNRNGTDVYKQILSYYAGEILKKNDDTLKYIADYVFRNYKMAYLDLLEEIVVRYIANSLSNTKAMYLNSHDTNFSENILSELLKQFRIMNNKVKLAINKDVDFDLGFISGIIKADGTRDSIMQLVKVSSLIEEGLKNNTILLNCKS